MAATQKHTTDSVEHYTPKFILDRVFDTIGPIDLDPASCLEANKLVGAKQVYTRQDNGLRQRWPKGAQVYLNPPGGLVDAQHRTVIRGKRGQPGCTVTGACGLSAPHKHTGVVSSSVAWWAKFMRSECYGCFLVYSLEMFQTVQAFDTAHPLDFPTVIFSKRVPFEHIVDGERVAGTQPPQASALVWAPDGAEKDPFGFFYEIWHDVGYVVGGAPE